jgi:hypothetical protein
MARKDGDGTLHAARGAALRRFYAIGLPRRGGGVQRRRTKDDGRPEGRPSRAASGRRA